MPYDLIGKTILVTGAGRGIGRSAAELMASYGAVIGAADIDPTTAEETAAVIRRDGGVAYAFSGDLSDREEFMRVGDTLAGVAGSIDGVVNAAMWIHYQPVGEIRDDVFDKMLGVGLKAPVWGTQVLLRHMRAGEGGSVINFSSPAAMQGYPTTTVYAAIKGAIVNVTRTLAVELGPVGVRVNAITPGPVPTPGARAVVDEAGYELRRRKTPLGRLGTETDIANAIAFLVSDEADFVTGAVLSVDGGCSLTA